MIILKQRIYSAKSLLGYGAGYIGGITIENKIGGKIGSKIKRNLTKEDLKSYKEQITRLEAFINYIKPGVPKGSIIDNKILNKIIKDDDEILEILGKYSINEENPDDYDYKLINKNKKQIIKESQDLIHRNQEILKNPESHPGNQEKLGKLIGSSIGAAGGLLAAHKIMNRK